MYEAEWHKNGRIWNPPLRFFDSRRTTITHYALEIVDSGKLTVIFVPIFSSLSSLISAPW